MDNKKVPKKFQTFSCLLCDYSTCRKSQYDRHNLTTKHKKITMDNEMNNKLVPKKYACDCGKIYNFSSGLSKHQKTCNLKTGQQPINTQLNPSPDSFSVLMNMFQIQLQENKEFKEMMLELQKQIIEISKDKSNTTHIIHNTNSHNKTFNLQVFLNETCKDAMNISEFIESLQIQVSDLENVGRVGYVDGIADIIVKNLKALDVSKRPVHCTDLKREILYVKDENKWEKDNIDKDKLRKAIKHIAHKNIKMIPAWKELNPAYVLDEGKSNDEYIQIIMKSMGGSDKAQDISYENKIISKLARCVAIDKDGIVL